MQDRQVPTETDQKDRTWFRVWIMSFEQWQPVHWDDRPPLAQAIEPVDEGLYSAEDAAAYLEGFNSASLRLRDGRWAAAIPVRVRLDGDLSPGQILRRDSASRGGPSAGFKLSAGSGAGST